jgi:hypothetical protein
MNHMDKNQPTGYGNKAKMAGNPAPDMKSNGSVKNNIPNAMTNKMSGGNECTGGKSNGVCYTHNRKSCQ